MSDDPAPPPGMDAFLPGWDFLKNLARGQPQPAGQLPGWVLSTVSIEEVDKRIAELKAVQFWIEQNGRALEAGIQALQVQRMTLATLQNMNVGMGELAQAFQGSTQQAQGSPAQPGASQDAGADASQQASQQAAAMGQAALQWWGALGQQFQQIALQAMKDQAAPPAPATGEAASGAAAAAGAKPGGAAGRKGGGKTHP